MMSKKTAAEVKAQVARMLKELPDGWLERKITAERNDPSTDLKTLEMICAALEDQAKKQRPKKRAPRKRTARVS